LAKDQNSLEVDMLLLLNERRPKRVSVAVLAKFYNSFFDASVTMLQMSTFIHKNVSLVVKRCTYSSPLKYVSQVVAALAFTWSCKDQATYLANLIIHQNLGSVDKRKGRPLL
jgi:hypothetical protein